MNISTNDITSMIGLDLTGPQIIEALERMGYGAKLIKGNQVQVSIPKFRMDILHSVDIIEDIAIGYGFDRLEPGMPQTMTMGKPNQITRIKNKVRDLMVGMGYQEIMNYIMSSPEILNEKMLRNKPLVTTGNPKSRNYSVLRNSLLPILLDFASHNQHADYPQKIFEVGDVAIPDDSQETCVKQVSSVCGLMADARVNITNLMMEIGFLLRNLGLDQRFTFESEKNTDFIQGRSAIIKVDGEICGAFGEISPVILSNFGIGYPLIAFELIIPTITKWIA